LPEEIETGKLNNLAVKRQENATLEAIVPSLCSVSEPEERYRFANYLNATRHRPILPERNSLPLPWF
jgi:hypothetical protein